MENKASDVPVKDASEALLYLMKAGLQRIRLKNRISLQLLSLSFLSEQFGEESADARPVCEAAFPAPASADRGRLRETRRLRRLPVKAVWVTRNNYARLTNAGKKARRFILGYVAYSLRRESIPRPKAFVQILLW